MDPQHRDRVAFVRICSGRFRAGWRSSHVRTGKSLTLGRTGAIPGAGAHGDRRSLLRRHHRPLGPGVLRIGDTLCEGTALEFEGIPRFSPDTSSGAPGRSVEAKALKKGLDQLSEEGAVQLFFDRNDGARTILGAVGVLQFEVIEHRLAAEYKV